MIQTKPHHPGRTPAQRRVLDAIGYGDPSPIMALSTKRTLLAAGLIEETGHQTVRRDRFGDITVPTYEMPIPVHIVWCSAVSASDECQALSCKRQIVVCSR